MSLPKNKFSIKELEEITGIKAHTIRTWEKRYQFPKPLRSDTNIRYYLSEELQKLLNVSYLIQNQHKISKLSLLNHQQLSQLVMEQSATEHPNQHLINQLKISMLSFDEPLFHKEFDKIVKERGFEILCKQYLFPFLKHVGLLWQTNYICPTHEHFISNLVREKFFAAIDKLSMSNLDDNTRYVLFLPEHEIHEIGLLFLHYLLRFHKKQSIYLGQSIPITHLQHLSGSEETTTHFITVFSMPIGDKELEKYNNEFCELADCGFNKISAIHFDGLNTKLFPKDVDLQSNYEDLLASILL